MNGTVHWIEYEWDCLLNWIWMGLFTELNMNGTVHKIDNKGNYLMDLRLKKLIRIKLKCYVYF